MPRNHVAPKRSAVSAEMLVVGSAEININALTFSTGRDLSQKIVDRLKGIYDTDGCHPHIKDNHIEVVVPPHNLQIMLRKSGETFDSFQKASREGRSCRLIVPKNQKIKCIQGMHRVVAALDFLEPHAQWWTADILSFAPQTPGVSKVIQERKERFDHQSPYSDGEIYQNIRRYQKLGYLKSVNKWKARLSPSKTINLGQLLRHEEFTKAFDELLLYPGLWAGFELGNIQKMLAMRCDEEILRYLRHVKLTWEQISLNEPAIQKLVSIETVQCLQLRTPEASSSDRGFISQILDSRYIFPTITDDERLLVKSAILNLRNIIPSLKTFHENLKYLDIGAKIIKDLILDKNLRSTISQALKARWQQPLVAHVEVYDNNIRHYTGLTSKTHWDIAYKVLWIFCLRQFPQLSDSPPRKEYGKLLPPRTTRSQTTVYQLAHLADTIGFKSRKLKATMESNPKLRALEECVSQLYSIPSSGRWSKELAREMLKLLPEKKVEQSRPASQVAFTSEEGETLERRWGRPYQNAYSHYKEFFYLPNMVQSENEAKLRSSPTPIYIQRDFISSFFGPTKLPHDDASEHYETDRLDPKSVSRGDDVAGVEDDPMSLDDSEDEHYESSEHRAGSPAPDSIRDPLNPLLQSDEIVDALMVDAMSGDLITAEDYGSPQTTELSNSHTVEIVTSSLPSNNQETLDSRPRDIDTPMQDTIRAEITPGRVEEITGETMEPMSAMIPPDRPRTLLISLGHDFGEISHSEDLSIAQIQPQPVENNVVTVVPENLVTRERPRTLLHPLQGTGHASSYARVPRQAPTPMASDFSAKKLSSQRAIIARDRIPVKPSQELRRRSQRPRSGIPILSRNPIQKKIVTKKSTEQISATLERRLPKADTFQFRSTNVMHTSYKVMEFNGKTLEKKLVLLYDITEYLQSRESWSMFGGRSGQRGQLYKVGDRKSQIMSHLDWNFVFLPRSLAQTWQEHSLVIMTKFENLDQSIIPISPTLLGGGLEAQNSPYDTMPTSERPTPLIEIQGQKAITTNTLGQTIPRLVASEPGETPLPPTIVQETLLADPVQTPPSPRISKAVDVVVSRRRKLDIVEEGQPWNKGATGFERTDDSPRKCSQLVVADKEVQPNPNDDSHMDDEMEEEL